MSDIRTRFIREGVRRPVQLAAAAGLIVLTPGCESIQEALTGQSQALCDQSVATARQAIEFEDFELARKWRDYAWKACAERGFIATLDKELLAAEQAQIDQQQADAKRAGELAQKRLNAANVLWLELDRDSERKGSKQALEDARKSAERLAQGLDPAYAKQVGDFNERQYKKRVAAMTR